MKLEEAIEKLEKTITDYQKEADRLSEFNRDRILDPCDEYIIRENKYIKEVRERTELVKWLKDYKTLLDKQNKQCQTCGRFIVGDQERCPTCSEVLK